jgi:hypothetical protein
MKTLAVDKPRDFVSEPALQALCRHVHEMSHPMRIWNIDVRSQNSP